jgi:Cd2+/Zn2+-exporting ATPase
VIVLRSVRALSHAGVYLKGAGTLGAAAGVRGVVLDYERTVTTGRKRVLKVLSAAAVGKRRSAAGEANDALLELAAAASVRQAEEEIRDCLRSAWGSAPDPQILSGHTVLLGDAEMLRGAGIPIIPAKETGEILYVSCDGAFRGYIVIGDPVRAEAQEAVQELRDAGVQEIALLAGEEQAGAEAFAQKQGIDEVLSVGAGAGNIREVLRDWRRRCGGGTAFVSCREVLSDARREADVTFAMGRKGGGARGAVKAADVVLRTGDLRGAGLTIAEGGSAAAAARRIGILCVLAELSVLVLRFVGVL